MSKKKQTYTPTLKYETFSEAMGIFITRHCVPATMDWNPHDPEYIQSEIRIVLNENGSGYIHLLGQDSETIDFKKMEF